MSDFEVFYTILGGLGIFIYGMKAISDALQQASGDFITKMINSINNNHLLTVLVGLFVTMIIQSSSVTTVMAVGMVNAGFMQLVQAIGIVIGSNIGTTVTGWILAMGNTQYALLFIGIGIFPAVFSTHGRLKDLGKAIFGLGMVYFGLSLMANTFMPLAQNEGFLRSISYFTQDGSAHYFWAIVIGCLLTMVVQSSSAMLGITMALALAGIIKFPTAVALVLGENIGTTISAILAAVGTTTNAKRAAWAHAIFNILGVAILFPFFNSWVSFLDMIVPGAVDIVDERGHYSQLLFHMAMAHTMFNLVSAVIFFPFISQLTKLVTKLIEEKKGENELPRHLILLGDSNDILPATAIVQADKEALKMKEILERMQVAAVDYLKTGNMEKLAKVKEYERITDNIQKEMTVFLCKVMEHPLSSAQSMHTQALIKIVDEFESIADYLNRIVGYKERFVNEPMSGVATDEFLDFMNKIWHFFQMCSDVLTNLDQVDENKIVEYSEELRVFADDMRDRHIDRISKGEYAPLTALTYSDMVVALRKIRAHAMNVATAGMQLSQQDE